MTCPKCGCKACYPLYDPEDYIGETEDMERCANCGFIFWIEEAEDDDDDFINENNPLE